MRKIDSFPSIAGIGLTSFQNTYDDPYWDWAYT